MFDRNLTLPLALLCLLASGCGKDLSPVAGPAADVEAVLKPGMTPDEVVELLGKPERDETPEDYDPPTIREFEYYRYGLTIYFHTRKGLGKIWLERRWTDRPLHGVRVGDIVLPDDPGFEEQRSDGCVHFESDTWPEALVYTDKVDARQDGHKVIGEKIRAITLVDDGIHGMWIPRLKSD